MQVSVDELTPETTGVWAVETQGSIHIWNLDEGWYARNPGREVTIAEIFKGFTDDFNGRKNYLHHCGDIMVDRWPKVGETFYVHLPPPNYWHQSSTIKSIKALA